MHFPALAAPTSQAQAIPLAQLLGNVEENNRDLVAARHRLEAAHARTGYAATLEEPRLGVSVMNLPTGGGPSVVLSREFPGPGKLRLSGEAAQREADAAEADYQATRLRVLSEAKQAYYDILYHQQALDIHHRIHDQLRNLLKIANTKYAVGSGLQQDPIRAQLEISKLLNHGLMLNQGLKASQSKLNALLNRPVDAPIRLSTTMPATAPVPSENGLLAQAEANSPELKALKAQIAAQRAQVDLVRREKSVPDFDVGIQAGRSMPGDMNFIGGMVGINLPWLSPNRFNQRIAEAEQALAVAEAQYEARRNDARFRVSELHSKLVENGGQVQLYRQGIIPQASQAVSSSLAAYQVNKVDFDTVLENQIAVYRAQTDAVRALANYHQTHAKLEAELGASPASK